MFTMRKIGIRITLIRCWWLLHGLDGLRRLGWLHLLLILGISLLWPYNSSVWMRILVWHSPRPSPQLRRWTPVYLIGVRCRPLIFRTHYTITFALSEYVAILPPVQYTRLCFDTKKSIHKFYLTLVIFPCRVFPVFPLVLDCTNVLMYHIYDTIQQRR